MISNNMKMLKGMDKLFDYEEYKTLCKEKGVTIQDLQQFCMGIGTLMIARERYPELAWQEAYIGVFEDINSQGAIKQKSSTKPKCCGGKKKEPPNLARKGINFAKALTEHIITGKKHIESNEYMRRLEICKGCDNRLEGFVCSLCGCYMGIKASWVDQKCGDNKW
ncbi:hypothetical protein KAR91_14705 [Candidatus Pacearchaeota archaeon]|nr:hypothetical protein [Candidatus Pacearchaeota archaeon]